jgi:hypothetical protein
MSFLSVPPSDASFWGERGAGITVLFYPKVVETGEEDEERKKQPKNV